MSQALERLLRLDPSERAEVLARLGLGANGQAGDDGAPPLRALPRDGDLPASFAQEQLWFLTELAPGVPMYNVPFRFDLEGPLDPAALAAAVRDVARRHEVLRSHLEMRQGGLVQVIGDAVPDGAVRTADLSGEADPDEAARARCEVAARTPFDLSRAPLWRAEVLRLDRDGRRHVLVWVTSHAVMDGWSTGMFLRELRAAYAARAAGRQPDAPPLALQFADFAAWQRASLTGERLERLLDYWRAQLAGVPPLDFPHDHPRPQAATYHGDELVLDIPAGVVDGLRRCAAALGVTPFAVFTAAYVLLLAHHSGQHDVAVGTPVAARPDPRLEPLIGSFVNTVALRVDCAGEPSFPELVARVRDTALDAFAHQDVPFGRLVQELSPARSVAYNPICQTVFSYGSTPLPDTEDPLAPDVALRLEGVPTGTARFDFEMAVEEWGGELHARFDFNTDLLERASAQRLCEQYVALLERVAAGWDVPAAQLVADLEPLPGVPPSQRTGDDAPAGAATASPAGAPPADPASSPTAAALVALWEEMLERPVPDLDTDFFALGGHSFLATRVVSRMRAELGVDLSLQDFFQHCTIRELTAIADAQREAPDGTGALDATAILEQVERMSDEEVARALRGER